MLIDFNSIDEQQRYKIVSSCVIPRPIAWISSQNSNGSLNLAPFSYFIPLSSNPPLLIVSIGHKKDGTPKDTLKNIKNRKLCTISIPTPSHISLLQNSAQEFDDNTSEVKELEISTKSLEANYPDFVSGCKAAFFCSFYDEIKLDASKTKPILLKIDKSYIDDDILQSDNTISFNALSRIAKNYGDTSLILKP